MKAKKIRISLPEIVGKGYGTFWRFRGRIRALKGSRRSKKSKTTALWFIYYMMKYKEANTIVVRKTYRTLKDSCFTELKWAAKRLQVEHLWEFKESPLEATYIPTGQKIYFRGMDDPLKITSVAVEVGVLCWLWIEEAYEITSEDDFDTLAESLMGDCPEDLWKQITLTFNPWSDKTWIKRRFFDEKVGVDAEGNPIYKERQKPISDDGEILAITTNYMCNEWLSPADRKEFERMKNDRPKRYRVAGLGHWGVVDGLVYENWKEQNFTLITKKEYNEMPEDKRPRIPIFRESLDSAFGLDLAIQTIPQLYSVGFCHCLKKSFMCGMNFIKKVYQTKQYTAKSPRWVMPKNASPVIQLNRKALMN